MVRIFWERGGGNKKIIKEQDKDFGIVIQSSYLLVFDHGHGLSTKRSKGMVMGEGLLRSWKRKREWGVGGKGHNCKGGEDNQINAPPH
jgi:hypothetical protein